ncbi:ABC transporter ATP-binding protein [Sediminicoccus rosea]|jgi:branched-chain amino acid transport system ATP-binding protein|uniref:ABC transporter ATP-binding protein n=1 Tax=Sediminicoccus rosea TaxID=1225128 RepID=A0ABZ0PLW6_9PROT|nr:ABC transporter ATP-binding protein [Sediminicoccus rosea]WPB86716.1 ABC transporter ATP-binding protein [Sediminicoccus rosea]
MTGHLELRGLRKAFGGVVATDDVSLTFEPGTLSAIIGPNGAGKTTLFHLITGKLPVTAGQVLLDGVSITGLDRREIVRRGIGRAFQVANLFPTFTVEDSLAAGLMAHAGRTASLLQSFPPPDVKRQAEEVMELCGLTQLARTEARHLSHGDQKLLDIALALALEPRVLLLDEPTAGMGPDERWRMIERVQRLWAARSLTLIFIEHDMDIVFKIAQNVRVLRYGAVLAEGTPEEVRRNPAVVEAYLGAEHAL